MARKPNKQNEKFAHIGLITQGLEYLGKPFYKILSVSLVILLFLFYQIGQLAKSLSLFIFFFPKALIRITAVILTFFITSFKELISSIFSVKISIPRFPKISLPKLSKVKKPKIIISVVIIVIAFSVLVLKDLPSPNELVNRDQEVSTKIYDRNGTLLYKIYKEKNRSIISLAEIPNNVIAATLAAEDAEFYSHPGFSLKGIIRAIIRNVKENKLTGGSTITQQLVKNALLSSEKTLIRKIRELILAVGVELSFTKNEILEMYLNEVSYGGTAYGIQEASSIYFGKKVSELTLAEAAYLAGLPKSPTIYSPFGSSPEQGLARQKDVINLMAINKFISNEVANNALNQNLEFETNKIDIKAPHFVMYVRQQLESIYGTSMVEKGGLEVTTTLDYSIQLLAEKVIDNELSKLKHLNVNNAAVIVVEPKTGEILAMVGSHDYFDLENDGNVNAVMSIRNPGSSIKPINYAFALGNGYNPATILKDSPVTFNVPGLPPYSPRNYDSKFRGNLSLRSALAESRNVTAVKVLASYGVDKMLELGNKMGITTWNDPSKYGLSLTLGGGGVKLFDLAQVYSVIANKGEKVNFQSVLKISNYKNKTLEEINYEQESVLDPRIAYLLINILSDNIARSPAFGTFSELSIPTHPEVAVKTGTSNDLRDNLTIGFNQNYLVAVWVGNNDNAPMSRIASGITGASPIWKGIISSLLNNQKSEPWIIPDGLINTPICSLTGTLPCQGCPTKFEWFLKEDVPTKKCNLKNIKKMKEKSDKKQLLPEAASTER